MFNVAVPKFDPPATMSSVPALMLTALLFTSGTSKVVVPAAFLLYVPLLVNEPGPPNAALKLLEAVSLKTPPVAFTIDPLLPVRSWPNCQLKVPLFVIARPAKSCTPAVNTLSVAPTGIVVVVDVAFQSPPVQVDVPTRLIEVRSDPPLIARFVEPAPPAPSRMPAVKLSVGVSSPFASVTVPPLIDRFGSVSSPDEITSAPDAT